MKHLTAPTLALIRHSRRCLLFHGGHRSRSPGSTGRWEVTGCSGTQWPRPPRRRRRRVNHAPSAGTVVVGVAVALIVGLGDLHAQRVQLHCEVGVVGDEAGDAGVQGHALVHAVLVVGQQVLVGQQAALTPQALVVDAQAVPGLLGAGELMTSNSILQYYITN